MFRQQRRIPTYEEFRSMYNEDKNILQQQIQQSGYKILEDLFPLTCQNNDNEFTKWLIDNNPKDKFPLLNINTILMMIVNGENELFLTLCKKLDYLKNDTDMASAIYNAHHSNNVEIFDFLNTRKSEQCIEMLKALKIN